MCKDVRNPTGSRAEASLVLDQDPGGRRVSSELWDRCSKSLQHCQCVLDLIQIVMNNNSMLCSRLKGKRYPQLFKENQKESIKFICYAQANETGSRESRLYFLDCAGLGA